MNYIGSKSSLLGEIEAALRKHDADPRGLFCDIFAGTSVVSQMARRMGFTVIGNDLQAYSEALQSAFLRPGPYPTFARLFERIPAIQRCPARLDSNGECRVGEAGRVLPVFGLGAGLDHRWPEARPLAQVLAWLEALPGQDGAFVEQYCEGGGGGRLYFSRENGRRCQAIRDTLAEWQREGLLSPGEFQTLLASLIESMDAVANTASVYGAHLKRVKERAREPLRLRLPRTGVDDRPHRVYRSDANALIRELADAETLEVLYIDPPYNRRQYHSNYHLLETIARWDLDEFTPQGVTGLRPVHGQRSGYALRRSAASLMRDLIQQSRARLILISYNNEGLIPEDELLEMLEARAGAGRTEVLRLPYRRFRADQDGPTRNYAGDEVTELLFCARVAG